MNDSTHVDDDHLLDLVNGLLDRAARQAALQHLRACPACSERLRVFAGAAERAHARVAQAVTVRTSRPLVAVPPGRPARSWSKPWLAAAALLLVSIPLWGRLARTPASLAPVADTRLPAPDVSILTRGGDEAALDPAVARGLELYASGDLTAARRALAGTTATGVAEQVRRLYLGNCELRTGDAARAVRTLRAVDSTAVPEPWLGEWQWSLAVALATSGDLAAADSLRERLALRPDSIGVRARSGWPVR